jgi:RHS repeat-associated protein
LGIHVQRNAEQWADTKQKDWVTGEEVSYSYDALQRLLTAQTTGPEWGLSFGYDGFGNKLSQTVTKGTAPSMSITVDANNRVTGQTFDANGNMTSGAGSNLTYDVDNRIATAAGASSEWYGYNPGNKRIWKKRLISGSTYEETIYFYSSSAKLMAATLTDAAGTLSAVNQKRFLYFGGQLILEGDWVVVDRLNSVRYRNGGTRFNYFPYGEEQPSATTQGLEKFATYERDHTGLDYADQRYFTNTTARFATPDPAGDGLNWYAYAGGDPVNNADPTGLAVFCNSTGWRRPTPQSRTPHKTRLQPHLGPLREDAKGTPQAPFGRISKTKRALVNRRSTKE